MDVVRKIENNPTQSDKPIKDVVITASGHVVVDKPFAVETSDADKPEGDEK